MPSFRFPHLARALAVVLPLAAAACNSDNDTTAPAPSSAPSIDSTTFAPALGVDLAASTRTVTGVYYRDIVVGTDTATAVVGKRLTVRYSGAFPNGTTFDAGTYPFTMGLNPPEVIPGWEDGIVGMHVGGQRQLVIPPERAYGPNGRPPRIPGNAILVFTVDLVSAR